MAGLKILGTEKNLVKKLIIFNNKLEIYTYIIFFKNIRDPRPMFHLTIPMISPGQLRPGWSPPSSFMVGYCKYLEWGISVSSVILGVTFTFTYSVYMTLPIFLLYIVWCYSLAEKDNVNVIDFAEKLICY